MYRIVINENDRCCAFMRARVPGCRAQDETCIGLESDGRLVACVLFDCYTLRDVSMHVAIDGRLTRAYIIAVFGYVFVQLGLPRATALVWASNARCRRFVEHLGFRLEGIRRDGAEDGDVMMYGMLAHECRFLARSAPVVRAFVNAPPVRTLQ